MLSSLYGRYFFKWHSNCKVECTIHNSTIWTIDWIRMSNLSLLIYEDTFPFYSNSNTIWEIKTQSSPEAEFKDLNYVAEPAKNRFQLSAGSNLETLHLQFQVKPTMFKPRLSQKFKGYRCKSAISIFTWRFICNYTSLQG